MVAVIRFRISFVHYCILCFVDIIMVINVIVLIVN